MKNNPSNQSNLRVLTADTILQKRYRILRPLGRGGMGAVYEAFDERLSRNVALKETLVETDELRRAFERESRLLANLRHPALPKVMDHFNEGADLFLVMEFIPGDDLGVMLEQGRTFTPREVLAWADQLLDALEYLHRLEQPVLHRDIKPSNLKLISPNQIVLLDFGLAKGNAGQMTRTNNESLLAYSPNYSPLEQMQGTGTDERSDLYSLGATLYHLLTGVKPPDALARATAVVNGQRDPLRPAREMKDDIPAPVSAALMRVMALNIENRPRTASAMRDDLHGMATRAESTVPMTEMDEATKVSLRTRPVITPATGQQQERGGRVVVPVPEDTWVARKQSTGGWKWVMVVVLVAGLSFLTVVLYIQFFGGETSKRAQTNPSTFSPGPSLTPIENSTPQENVNAQADNFNGQPVLGPTELAARTTLEHKRLPFTEAAFTKVVEDGDTRAVDLFLTGGMNPDAKDASGRTALVNAAARGSDSISKKLLGKGADVNARDNSGSTALMESAQSGHKETTKVLLENGADVNLTDNNGQTALVRSAAQGHTDIVRMLINQGARTDLKDRDGRDALTWAQINDRSDVIALLKKAGSTKP